MKSEPCRFTHCLSSTVFLKIAELCVDSPLFKISRYLFPFVLEYSLIAIGSIAFILYSGIGPDQDSSGHHHRVARGFKNLVRVFADSIYMDNKKDEDSDDDGDDKTSNGSEVVERRKHRRTRTGLQQLRLMLFELRSR